MTSTKYIGMDVQNKESISIAGDELHRQGCDGMRHRDQGEHHPAVYPGAAPEICMSHWKKEPGRPGYYDPPR